MKFLLKLFTGLLLIFIALLIASYATLLPKPFKKDIVQPQEIYTKTLDGSLKVITYNLGLLDIRVLGRTVFKPTEFIKERAQLIPQQLLNRDADIIALQEIYEKHHINYFINQLKNTYPYYYFEHQSPLKLNNGLMIFSKFPFVSTNGESQNDKGPIDEWLIADRGLISAVIKLSENITVNIVNMHATSGGTLNAQDSDKLNLMRQNQLQQALKFALNANTDYQMIVGDINAGPGISEVNYKYLLENDFTDAYANYSKKSGIEAKPTWLGSNALNAMRGYTEEDAQRIDHIYLSKQLSNSTDIQEVQRIFDANAISVDGKHYPLSDHYGVELELTFK